MTLSDLWGLVVTTVASVIDIHWYISDSQLHEAQIDNFYLCHSNNNVIPITLLHTYGYSHTLFGIQLHAYHCTHILWGENNLFLRPWPSTPCTSRPDFCPETGLDPLRWWFPSSNSSASCSPSTRVCPESATTNTTRSTSSWAPSPASSCKSWTPVSWRGCSIGLNPGSLGGGTLWAIRTQIRMMRGGGKIIHFHLLNPCAMTNQLSTLLIIFKRSVFRVKINSTIILSLLKMFDRTTLVSLICTDCSIHMSQLSVIIPHSNSRKWQWSYWICAPLWQSVQPPLSTKGWISNIGTQFKHKVINTSNCILVIRN